MTQSIVMTFGVPQKTATIPSSMSYHETDTMPRFERSPRLLFAYKVNVAANGSPLKHAGASTT